MKLHFISMLLALQHLPAFSTSFHPESIESFSAKARHIVRGTVKNQRVEKVTGTDGSITIYTYALVEVKEPLKGGIDKSEIRVRRLGGETEGYHHEVPGSPEFKENEDTVLFLTGEQEDGSFEIESMEIGKFGVRMENGSEILTGGMLQYLKKPGDPSSKPLTLDGLRNMIRSAPASGGPSPSVTGAGPAQGQPQGSDLKPSAPGTPVPESTGNASATPAGSSDWIPTLGLLVLAILGFLGFRTRRKP